MSFDMTVRWEQDRKMVPHQTPPHPCRAPTAAAAAAAGGDDAPAPAAADVARRHAVIVTADTRGFVRVYENAGPLR
jgi:hypothetical protein